ncbi:hypothetical protein [Histidinibacterium aquaticum]|uniref:DUF1795 domain-containing protein n=1 Tax=Histidinibacterium aquaticum TaxID=2613962 RepID=A0A5J5GLX1_9RHOB|nr:hypothetical protein [Histidinibacterium aquaticum]KAA9009195.1 hypothetical protein F3S47_08045 [Histidinibacterium aquaticum]
MKTLGALLLGGLGAASTGLAQDCTPFSEGVAFCAAEAGLSGGDLRENGPTAYYTESYGVLVEVAPLSATSYTDPAFMRANLDAYLAERKGFSDGLPALERDRIDLGDRPAEQVVYREGERVIADTLALGDGYGVYVQTLAVAESFTEEHRLFHDRVLAALRLPEPANPDVWGVRADRPEARPLATASQETDE